MLPLSRLMRVGLSETMIIGCKGHPPALLSSLTTGGDVATPEAQRHRRRVSNFCLQPKQLGNIHCRKSPDAVCTVQKRYPAGSSWVISRRMTMSLPSDAENGFVAASRRLRLCSEAHGTPSSVRPIVVTAA